MTLQARKATPPDGGGTRLGGEAEAVAAELRSRPVAPVGLALTAQAAEGLGLLVLSAALLLPGGADGPTWLAVLLMPIATVAIIHAAGLYAVAPLGAPVAALARVMGAWTLAVLAAAALGFFLELGETPARGRLALLLLAGIVFLIAIRAGLAALVARRTRAGRLDRRAVIVGAGEEAEALIDALMAEAATNIRICGLFDDRGPGRSPDQIAGLPKLGTVAELVEFARIARIDLLIVALPPSAETRLLQILKQLFVLPVDIRLSALGSRLRFHPRAYSHIGSIPLIDVFDRPIAGFDAVLKRSFDLVVASAALLLLSPLMLAAALAVRIDSPGPILFRQKRYGFNNEVIDVLKFRSMYHHLADPAAKVVVTKGDPRVTRVGRFIRKTSIDELPQLFNVIAGALSIVGPRPHALNAHVDHQLWDEVVDGYFARHRVKPGITGWAQINGWRGEVDTPEKIRRRVEFDLDYIDRWSIAFDAYIVLMTPISLFRAENAY